MHTLNVGITFTKHSASKTQNNDSNVHEFHQICHFDNIFRLLVSKQSQSISGIKLIDLRSGLKFFIFKIQIRLFACRQKQLS